MEIVIVSVVEIARESELKAQNKDETELWWSYDKTLTEEDLLLIDEQRKGFYDVECGPDEDAVNTDEITKKD
jgi:hypothetical protein